MHSVDQNTEFVNVKNLAVLKINTICTGRKYFLWKIIKKVNYLQKITPRQL